MSRAELVAEWNGALEFKISESDLTNPTETFVVRALLVLLDNLNIQDTFSILMGSEDKLQAQVAKATFVKFIDRLYKISDPKASFVYGDMAFPQPARTMRVLKYLLNYLFYYNSMRDEVLNRVKVLDEYNHQKSKNNELHVELEKLKIQKENAAKLMTKYESEENMLRKRHDEMEAYSRKVEDEFKQLENTLKEYEPLIKHLNEKAEILANQLVDKDTANQLLVLQEQLKQHKLKLLEDPKQDEKDGINVLKEHNKMIEAILIDLEEIDKLISALEIDVQEIKRNIEDCVKATDRLANNDEKLNPVELNNLLDENTKNMKRINKKIKKMNKVRLTKETELERLTMKNKEIVGQLERNKRDMAKIIAIGKKVLQIMAKNNLK